MYSTSMTTELIHGSYRIQKYHLLRKQQYRMDPLPVQKKQKSQIAIPTLPSRHRYELQGA